nr:putative reverse transcriptase domain-containing protein [Tanacetum cinerariifolium]
MSLVRFHCPFVGVSGCEDGGGNEITKTSLITHLYNQHCSGEAQAITKQSILSDLVVYKRAELTFKHMGLWLCGVCFKTHMLRSKCHHGNSSDFMSPPDCGYVRDLHNGFTLALLDNLFSKGLRTVKSIPLKCRLGFSRALKGALDKVICKPDDIYCWVSFNNIKKRVLLRPFDLGNITQCKRKISDRHYTVAVRVLSSFGVAPYSDATLEDLKIKHPFKHAPSLPHIPFDHHHLIASSIVVLDRIKSFPRGISCGRDSLRAQYLIDYLIGSVVAISNELVSSITQVVNLSLGGSCPKMLGEYIASAPLTLLVKPGGGIRPIAIDSSLIVPVFQKGNDPIDAINHMMSFLTAAITSWYPTTSNQLGNSSNLRQQATINNERVTLQPVQRRHTSLAAGTSRTYTPGANGNNSRKQRTVIYYNCKEEGHMSKTCTKPKRRRDDSWFKDKVLLVQAQANGQILHEEELAFLVDPGIVEAQPIQTVITHNAAYQAMIWMHMTLIVMKLTLLKLHSWGIYLIMVQTILLRYTIMIM